MDLLRFPGGSPDQERSLRSGFFVNKKGLRRGVWCIVITYIIVAGLWILFSDELLARFVSSPQRQLEWSILKGWLFVGVTGAMLYVLISRLMEKLWRFGRSWEMSERKFRTLFEKVTDGIAVIDFETRRFQMANPAFERLLGYTEEELRQFVLADIHPTGSRQCVLDLLEPQPRAAASQSTELTIKRKNNTVFCAAISATEIALENRRHVIAVFRDVTQQKRAQTDLKEAKENAEAANRAKDEFIAVLSHELRAPLMPVLATVSAMQSAEEVPPALRQDLEVVRRNMELESRLIDDLLDVTRISRGLLELRPEPVDVHACLHLAAEICQGEIDAKRLKLSWHLEAARHRVWADSARLQQVFWNLLKNAVKFTPEEGTITLRSVNFGEQVSVVISDSGIGMDSQTLSRIFGAFEQGSSSQRRRFGGLGLGLNIAKRIMEMHDGTLTAASEGKGMGARFTVELMTMKPESEPERPKQTPAVPGMQSTARILLVDDHVDTLQILERLLRKLGYAVETAVSVQSALELAGQNKFDVLISDLGLPDGSGREIMKHVKQRYGLRGIALSGFSTEEDVRASREAGFDEHFVKPVSFSAMNATVQRILAEQKSAAN